MVFSTSGTNFVTLTWTGHVFSHGYVRDWRTDGHTESHKRRQYSKAKRVWAHFTCIAAFFYLRGWHVLQKRRHRLEPVRNYMGLVDSRSPSIYSLLGCPSFYKRTKAVFLLIDIRYHMIGFSIRLDNHNYIYLQDLITHPCTEFNAQINSLTSNCVQRKCMWCDCQPTLSLQVKRVSKNEWYSRTFPAIFKRLM